MQGGFIQQMGYQQPRRSIGNVNQANNRGGGFQNAQSFSQNQSRTQNQIGNRTEGVIARLGGQVRSPITTVRNGNQVTNKPMLSRPGQEKTHTPPAEHRFNRATVKKHDDQTPAKPAPVPTPAGKPESRPAAISASGRKLPITAPGGKPAPITAPVSKPVPITAPKPAPITAPKPTPITAPKPTPITAPKPTPITAPKPAPITAPKPAPITAPKPAPIAAPKSAPITTPKPSSTPPVKPAPITTPKSATPASVSSAKQSENATGGRQINEGNRRVYGNTPNNQVGNRFNNQQGNRQVSDNQAGSQQNSNNQQANRQSANSAFGNRSAVGSHQGHWQSQSGGAASKQSESSESSKPMPLMNNPIMNNPRERHSRFNDQKDSANAQGNPEPRNSFGRQTEDHVNVVKPNPVMASRLGPKEDLSKEQDQRDSANKYMKNNNQQRVKPIQGRGGNVNQWNDDGKKSGPNARSKPRQGFQGNRDQNDGGRDFRREGGRGRGGYGQDKFWERLNEIRGEQYDLEPLDMSEKKFNAQARLFAGSLARDTTTEEIEEMFSKFGEIGQVYHNKEGTYAFVNFDYRANAEKAVRELHGTPGKHGRNLMVRFAAITTGVRVKNLSATVTNELLYKAFSVFGVVELCRVIVDDRGKPTGDGIIIFNEKKPAVMAYKKCQEESYFLTNQLRPVIVEPWETRDDEEGFPECSIQKNENYRKDRRVGPRFAELGSYESDYGKRWKQLFDIYKEKKLALENDLKAEMEALEVKMQLVVHQQETEKLRRELAQREQEALQLQRGLGSFGEQIRPTQLSAPSNEYGALGAQQQGVKRPHDYSEQQQQGRDYYGEYYQQSNQQYGSGNANPYGQPRQQQETSYGNVSGVSGTAYDRVEPAPASTNEREGLTDVAKAELERPDRLSCPDAYASVPAGQQQTIETYTRQSQPQEQQRYDFDSANKRGRY